MSARRSVFAIVSVGMHAGLFLALSLVPTPAIVVQDAIGSTPIEIVPWRETIEKPGVREATATDVGDAATTGAPIADTRAEPRAAQRTAQRARARVVEPRGERTVDPASASTPSVDDDDTNVGTRPPAKALALHGLRDAVPHDAAVPSPRVSPSAIGPAETGPARGGTKETGAEVGPVSAGAADRGMPRTLAEAGFVSDGKGNHVYRSPQRNFVATMMPDGRVRFRDKVVKVTPTTVQLPDLYVVIRKAQGGELWANDKANLLERTFDLRLAIALAYAEANIDRRIKALYRELIDAWSADRPAIARRKTIFDRWDECDESMRVRLPGFEDAKGSRLDELRETAGNRARDEIHGFIRKHLAKGSEHAYPESEIDALNRRRTSKQRFAPYEDPPKR